MFTKTDIEMSRQYSNRTAQTYEYQELAKQMATSVAQLMGWETKRHIWVDRSGIKRHFGHFNNGTIAFDPIKIIDHDYEILSWVRQEDPDTYEAFCEILETMWIERGFTEYPFAAYEPGDYTRALLFSTKSVSIGNLM